MQISTYLYKYFLSERSFTYLGLFPDITKKINQTVDS